MPNFNMRVIFLFCALLIVAQGSLANDQVNTYSIELTSSDNCVIDSKTTVRCDQLADSLRSVHARSDAWINLLIDNAKYETVVATLDSLGKKGFTDVDVMPPINGTNPSTTVKQWIRLRVEGQSNHPFAMLLISTERFKTWREELLVVSPSRFDEVDRFARSRIIRPDCKGFGEFRFEPPYDHNTISISEHTGDVSRGCVLPKAESCDFLSELMDLPEVNWSEAEIQPVKHVRAELRCKEVGISN